jgi:hypothetical protein
MLLGKHRDGDWLAGSIQFEELLNQQIEGIAARTACISHIDLRNMA